MNKTRVFAVLIIIIMLLTGCAKSVGDAVVTVSGKEYTKADLEKLGMIDVDYTDKDGNITTYSGVVLTDLLADSGLSGTTITFTAADGYQADIELAELTACSNCILAFDGDSLRTVMPEMSGKLQVKEVTEITGN